jgi:hypothetical protein
MINAKRRPGRVEVGVERYIAHINGRMRRFAVEAQQVAQHSPESEAHGVSRLRKKAGQASAGIFQATVIERNGESHIGGLGRDSQMIEQR